MVDIFDTKFEAAKVEVFDNRVKKGEDVNVSAKDPTLKRLHVGCGWDLNTFDTDSLDLDMSCFLLDKTGKTRMDEDFVFYNNMQALGGAVRHSGDSRTGAGDGDDEFILLDLAGIPFDIIRVLFVLTIYQANYKEQNIGMIRNSYLRLVNADTMNEIMRYELRDELRDRKEGGIVIAALDREGPKWHFRTIGEGVPNGLPEVAEMHGIIVGQS